MSRFDFWAASLAPYDGNGRVDVSRIPEQAEHLRSIGVRGAFVNGTSGEFPFLTVDERVQILEAWVRARPEGFGRRFTQPRQVRFVEARPTARPDDTL